MLRPGDPLSRYLKRPGRRRFARVVTVYSPYVWELAFRATGHEDDAADVFQDVFLKLLLEPPAADALRSARGYLAWRVADRARFLRRSAERRRRREARHALAVAQVPDDAAVDAEAVREAIEGLPEELRVPVELRYLLSLRPAEVAESLDLTERAVRDRLERARDKLRYRLAPLYPPLVLLSGGLVKAPVAPPVPERLLSRLETASVRGAQEMGLGTAGKSARPWLPLGAAAVLLSSAAIFWGLTTRGPQPSPQGGETTVLDTGTEERGGGLPPAGLGDGDATDVAAGGASAVDPPAVAVAPPLRDGATLVGVTQDAAGRPLAGAQVTLCFYRNSWGLGNELVETVSTDARGGFRFESELTFDVANGTTYTDHYVVLATHPEAGLAWSLILSRSEPSVQRLTLGERRAQEVLVTDEEGAPLEGAEVYLRGAGEREGRDPLFPSPFRATREHAVLLATTDKDGLARVDGLPATRCSFGAYRPGYTEAFSRGGGSPEGRVTLELTPAAVVRGTVTTAEGAPVADAEVWLRAAWRLHWRVGVLTDAAGRFELDTLVGRGDSWCCDGGSGAYRVTLLHPDFALTEQRIQVERGEVFGPLDLLAVAGTLLRVTVVEPGSKRPVPGARLTGSSTSGRLDGYTDADGVFERRVTPGDVQLGFSSPPGGHYVSFEERPPSQRFRARDEVQDVELELPGTLGTLTAVSGRVTMPDGKPAAGVSLEVRSRVPYRMARGGRISAVTRSDGTFVFARVPVGAEAYVYGEVEDRGHVLIERLQVDPADSAVAFSLQPTGTTTVLLDDDDGTVFGATKVNIIPLLAGLPVHPASRTASTDPKGVLELDGVLPGLRYSIQNDETKEMLRESLELLPVDAQTGGRVPDWAVVEPAPTQALSVTPTRRPLPLPPVEEPEEETAPWHLRGAERTRYLLSQYAAGSLLSPMVLRLYEAARETSRDGTLWIGVDGGVDIELELTTDSQQDGLVLVGLFSDPGWDAPPVQVREMEGAGTHRIERVPPGRYVVGAAILEPEPRVLAVGVHAGWPERFDVGPEDGATVALEVSETIVQGAMRLDALRLRFGPGSAATSGSARLEGVVRNHDGSPVPFADVRVYGEKSSRPLAADATGRFRANPVHASYNIGAFRTWPLFDVLGTCMQHVRLDDELQGRQKIDIHFAELPRGTARLTGRVTDQDGDPVRAYYLNVSATDRTLMYNVPCLGADGRFELGNLPPMECSVSAGPFEPQGFDLRNAQKNKAEVRLEEGETTTLSLTVPRKKKYYARVLFEDGTPFGRPAELWPETSANVGHTEPRIQSGPMKGMSISHIIGSVSAAGMLVAHLSPRDVERLEQGETHLDIDLTIEGQPANLNLTISVDDLTTQREAARTLEVSCPAWLERKLGEAQAGK